MKINDKISSNFLIFVTIMWPWQIGQSGGDQKQKKI
jgi:hypothetical protein